MIHMNSKYFKFLLLIMLCLIYSGYSCAQESQKKKNVIRVPYLLLSLEIKAWSGEHGGNWQITQILIKGKNALYHYKYVGYHPDPFFKRKIDKEFVLNGKETVTLVEELENSGLLKNITDTRPHTNKEDSINIDLMIRLRDMNYETRIFGLVKDFMDSGKGGLASYNHYRKIVSFADYINNLATAKQKTPSEQIAD